MVTGLQPGYDRASLPQYTPNSSLQSGWLGKSNCESLNCESLINCQSNCRSTKHPDAPGLGSDPSTASVLLILGMDGGSDD